MSSSVAPIITAFLAVFIGLFPIVNPLGMAPIFLRLTEGGSPDLRPRLAWRVALACFCLLVGSLFLGAEVLAFFGLTLPAVRVAGGMVVTAAGWRLLSQGEDTQERGVHAASDDVVLHRAFYPLAMPLTVGPGSISVAITLGAKSGDQLFWQHAAGGLLGVAALSVAIYLCYRFAPVLLGRLGAGGTDVVLRLSAFLLLCLGVQIFWTGYVALTQAQ